jgi:DNA polymerase-1
VLYRSFFALPDSITDGENRPVNALLGAANLVLRIAADQHPRAIVICLGQESASYRVELYEPYHAQRPRVPDALAWQFDQAPEFFEAFGWTCVDSGDLEADDLLGSLAAAEAAAGGEALIMTGDRDMYQCASERVRILMLKAGKVGFEAIDPAEVKRRYGIPPELVPDFIALRGDPSDGLPGAKGVGPKTAAELLRAHGSLEGTIEATRSERPRLRAAVYEAAEQLRAFKEIATLRSVAVERPGDRETDLDGGAQAARRLGMGRLAQRLEDADSVDAL